MNNLLEESQYIICKNCNHRVINYPNQLCRRQFLPSQRPRVETRGIQINKQTSPSRWTSGNSKLDEFIEETQQNSKFCDDFVEWIPNSNLENIKFLTGGGNSEVYHGIWNLLLNISLASKKSSTNIVLKAIRDSDNDILNEVKEKMNYKFKDNKLIKIFFF